MLGLALALALGAFQDGWWMGGCKQQIVEGKHDEGARGICACGLVGRVEARYTGRGMHVAVVAL